MKLKANKAITFLVVLFIIAFALRIYKLSFFEFKNDQLDAIEMANDVRNSSFLISHGVRSGVGISNPPFLLYLMGAITFFTQDPFWITAFFMLVSTLGLLLALHYFYRQLPLTYAMLSSVILAFSPAFNNYTAIIWPQCLLPFFMILYHKTLYRFIEESNSNLFFVLTIITTVVAMLHMSGFFLYPVLFLIGIYYRKKIGLKCFIKSFLSIIVISSPYLYHIIFERELGKFISFGLAERSVHWKIFRQHIRMASFDFFRHHFRYDLNAVLDASVGWLKFILYPLSCILIALFAFALLYYLIRLIKSRKIFDNSPEVKQEYPLAFQISGFILLVVTVSYLLFRVQTPPHYLIILFPCYSIMAGFCAWKIWRFRWGKTLISLSILSTFFLMVAVLAFIKGADGHPHEYGPHYGTLLKWRQQVQAMIPQGYCPDLLLEGKGKFDEDTIRAVIMSGYYCNKNVPRIPLKLIVNWNNRLMRYEHSIDNIDEFGN